MTFGIQDVLDKAPLGSIQARVIALVAITLVIEGFDIQLAAFAAPAITAEWSITAAAMGPTLAAVMAGMAIGGVFGGALGDRWGRRPALMAAIAIFGITTCLASLSSQLWHLTILRLVAGIGFGAAYPNATVLVGEWAPLKVRAKAIALLTMAFPIGGLIGASISSELIPTIGWRLTFLVAGALPLVVAVIMFLGLPESLVFQARDPSRHAMIRRTLAHLSKGQIDGDAIAMSGQSLAAAGEGSGGETIFGSGNRRVTVGLWIAFFSNLTVAYLVINWLPMLLTMLGVDQASAIRGSFYMNLAGIVGLVMAALIYPRLGSRKSLLVMVLPPAAAVLAAGLFTLYGQDASASASFMVLAGTCLAFWGVSGTTACLWSLSLHAYAVATRSTGLGWANSFGRLGGITSTLIGGSLMLLEPSPFVFLAFVALALLAVALGVLVVDRHAPRISTNEVAAKRQPSVAAAK